MRIRREPEDDLLHEADDDPNFNESRYYSFSDRPTGLGGWVRMGNRPNEGYAEMTVCLYLPDGRVGFMFKRPPIDGHHAHDAGGLRFEVVAPYEEHHVTFDGKVCVLANPREMADPKSAFAGNPHEPCVIDLHLTAAADPSGGEPEWDEGEEPPPGSTHQFARGHTEQHMASTRCRPGRRRRVRGHRELRVAGPFLGSARLAEHLVVSLDPRELRFARRRLHPPRRTRRRRAPRQRPRLRRRPLRRHPTGPGARHRRWRRSTTTNGSSPGTRSS